jgi:spermidine synthase
MLTTWVLKDRIFDKDRLRLRARGTLLLALLLTAFVSADRITHLAEEGMYAGTIVYAAQSPYQRIVLTRGNGSHQLFLNGNLQFSTADEYRYHEALVHPAFAAAQRHTRVLVLGGGDGLAMREILKYPDVEAVTLVDLDPEITRLATESELLRELNHDALHDPRVNVVSADAMVWLDREVRDRYDVLIVDFPDPNNFSLGKLYTTWFYHLLQKAMHEDSVVAVQSTSPLFARNSFWCVVETMRAAGLSTQPYHAPVPAFGEWGYVLARRAPFDRPTHLRLEGLRYLNDETLRSLFIFAEDMGPVPVEPNRLNNQLLVQYYEQDWGHWN